MKKNISFLFLQIVFIMIVLSSFVYWGESKSQNLSITVTVEPMRSIIVDRDLRIVTIISNTQEDVRPLVYLDTRDGLNLPFAEGIQQQYNTLKPVINFSKPGVVYQRDTRVTLSIFKTAISTIQKLLGVIF
jgi:hypothetical protein